MFTGIVKENTKDQEEYGTPVVDPDVDGSIDHVSENPLPRNVYTITSLLGREFSVL